MGMIKAAMADAFLTSMWVSALPFMPLLTSLIGSQLGLQPNSLLTLFLTINISTFFVLTFIITGALLGGASFNPTTTVSSHAAGLNPRSSLLSLAIRLPAQAAGGVAGAVGISKLMPEAYRHFLKGPSLKVDLQTGAIAEGLMGFVFSLALLLVMLKGPKNLVLKVYLVSLTTVGLVICGGQYTGPSLNPANAYGWAYVNNWHNSWELFYVYWVCPFLGGIIAAFVYKLFFKAPPVVKQKAA